MALLCRFVWVLDRLMLYIFLRSLFQLLRPDLIIETLAIETPHSDCLGPRRAHEVGRVEETLRDLGLQTWKIPDHCHCIQSLGMYL